MEADALIPAAVASWAHCIGVTDKRPIDVATERAAAAYRDGASVANACLVAPTIVLSWLRHPVHTERRRSAA